MYPHSNFAAQSFFEAKLWFCFSFETLSRSKRGPLTATDATSLSLWIQTVSVALPEQQHLCRYLTALTFTKWTYFTRLVGAALTKLKEWILKVENPQEDITDILIAQLIQNIFLQMHLPKPPTQTLSWADEAAVNGNAFPFSIFWWWAELPIRWRAVLLYPLRNCQIFI